ncbi:hypothetical protein D1007_49390 [Hordeum vulgare]|nr:hypothetical protein D1007_49390 [Hordeum vulgare]
MSRKKLNSDEEDVDFIPEEIFPQKQKEKTNVRKTVTKEYARPDDVRAAEATQRGLKLTLGAPSSKPAKNPGYSINMSHHLDTHTRFRVIDLIVKTVRSTTADRKRSCGYAPYIQMLINAKIGNHAYQLDLPHCHLS